MNISRYVQALQNQLAVAAEAGGDDAKIVAERLTSTLDSTARLVLLEALSDAAGEITAELAPGSVDVRLRGHEPEFVVSAAPAPRFEGEASAQDLLPEAGAFAEVGSEPGDADAVISRTTLRLPESVKLRVETAATREGLSVNSWLLRAVTAALATGSSAGSATGATASQVRSPLRNSGSRFTGWVR